MTDKTSPISTLIDRAEDYSNATIELFKLNAIDKTADIVSSLVSRIVILIIIGLSVVFVSIGAALWLGKIFEEPFCGFFVIGGIYIFIAILLRLFRRVSLKNPVSNTIIKQMLKQKAS